METRTYTVTINAISSDSVNFGASLSDGWMMFKGIRFINPNKKGLHWNFNNSQRSDGKYYSRTTPASFLEFGLNHAMEKLVDLEDGLTFDVTVSDDPYERPIVENVKIEKRKKKGETKAITVDKSSALDSIREQIAQKA